MIRVAEWIRVSDESQASPERFGIPAQKSVNLDTCKRFGLEVIKTFQVEDVSGKDILLASETHELIELMKSGRIQGVVAREFSRLMRPDDFADYVLLSEFQKTKTILYLPEGTIDFNDKMGRLMAGMQASISGYERSTIRERLHRGNEENRKAGGRFASTLPRGVNHSVDMGWYYTSESNQVLRAYEMVLAGDSLSSIGAYLNMSAAGVKYLIHNPIYKGWRVYERECKDGSDERKGKNGRQVKYRPMQKRSDEKIIRVQVISDPLVSPETWERACQILDAKSDSRRRNRKTLGLASYNGFLYCDECGRVLTPMKGSGAGYYVCIGHYKKTGCTQKYTRIADMESRIDRLIGGEMSDPDFLRQLADSMQAMQANDTRTSKIQQLETESKSLDRKRSRILDLFTEGDITRDEKTERLEKLSEKIGTVTEELTRLQSSVPASATLEQLVSMFHVFSGWETYSVETRRKMLSLYVPRMRVRDGQIVSVYRLLDGQESRYDTRIDMKSSSPSTSLGRSPC
jgi:site-specific DNA recombinase